jgi:2-dehydropantoate 2-reductase
MEIDALVTVVQELGLLTGVATPTVDVVLALVKERANASGLYQPLRPQPASDGTD